MIAWKTGFGCAHSAVKMIRVTLTIRPKQKFFYDDIVRTVRGDAEERLDAVNNLHPIFNLHKKQQKQVAISGHVN